MSYSDKAARRTVEGILLKRQKGICGLCDMALTGIDTEIDHKKPKSIGGTDDIDNLHLVHRDCHMDKHSVNPDMVELPQYQKALLIKKPHKMNELRKKYYIELAETIRRKLIDEQPIKYIADELNISRQTVYDIIRKFQLR